MKLPPIEFGYRYITRSGRISNERLRQTAPKFMARYDEYTANKGPGAAQASQSPTSAC
jgi:hypothetical protein